MSLRDCLVWRLNNTTKEHTFFIFFYTFFGLGELLKSHRISDFVLPSLLLEAKGTVPIFHVLLLGGDSMSKKHQLPF